MILTESVALLALKHISICVTAHGDAFFIFNKCDRIGHKNFTLWQNVYQLVRNAYAGS